MTTQPDTTEAARAVVYEAALETLRKGAPGLSDITRMALARSINMKVGLITPLATPPSGNMAEAVARMRHQADNPGSFGGIRNHTVPVQIDDLRTVLAALAHPAPADKLAYVLHGVLRRGRVIDAETIDRVLEQVSLPKSTPTDEDRAWAASLVGAVADQPDPAPCRVADAGFTDPERAREVSEWLVDRSAPEGEEPVAWQLRHHTETNWRRDLVDAPFDDPYTIFRPLYARPASPKVEVAPPDEMTENELRSRAKALLRLKGWRPKDKIHIHGMIELLTTFGMDLSREPAEDRCGYPSCGCDADAVCDAAIPDALTPSSGASE